MPAACRWARVARLAFAAAMIATAAVKAQEYAGEQCIGVVDFPLNGSVDGLYAQEAARFAALPVPPYLKETIARALRRTLCLEIFAPAATSNNVPCADACADLYAQFAGDITANLAPAWAKFGVPTLADCQTYPTDNCQKGGEPVRYEEDKAQCPLNYERASPSDYKMDGKIYFRVADTDCSPNCPVRLYSESEWNFATTLAFGISWAGSILSAIVLGCYLYYKRSQHLVICFTFSCFVSSFAVAVFLTFGGADELVCLSDTVWDEKSAPCIAQAVFTVWGFISAVCWTVCQALDVHARVVLEYRHTKIEKVRRWYPFIGGVIPIVAVVMLLATDHLGLDVRSPFDVCFITKDGAVEYLYVFFVGIQAAACLTCLVMMIGVIARITSVMQVWDRNPSMRGSMSRPSNVTRVSQSNVKAESASARALRYNSRPIMFIVLCVLICAMNVILVLYYIDMEDEVYSGAVDYARCIFRINTGGIDDKKTVDECGRLYKDRQPVEVHASLTAGISCLAVLPFLVYGYSLPPTRAFLTWLTKRHFSDSHDPQEETSDQDSGTIFSWRFGIGRSRASAGSSTRARVNVELGGVQSSTSPASPRNKSDTAASHHRQSDESQMRSSTCETTSEGTLSRINSSSAFQTAEQDAKRRVKKVLDLNRVGSTNSLTSSEKAAKPHDVESPDVGNSHQAPEASVDQNPIHGELGQGSSKSVEAERSGVAVNVADSDQGSDREKLTMPEQETLPPNTRAHFDL